MKPLEYLVTGDEMQYYDTNTILHFKVPALVLMEQAAVVSYSAVSVVASELMRRIEEAQKL